LNLGYEKDRREKQIEKVIRFANSIGIAPILRNRNLSLEDSRENAYLESRITLEVD
jgi:hypothetical protein